MEHAAYAVMTRASRGLYMKYSPGVVAAICDSWCLASSKLSTALIQIGQPSGSRLKMSNFALIFPTSAVIDFSPKGKANHGPFCRQISTSPDFSQLTQYFAKREQNANAKRREQFSALLYIVHPKVVLKLRTQNAEFGFSEGGRDATEASPVGQVEVRNCPDSGIRPTSGPYRFYFRSRQIRTDRL